MKKKKEKKLYYKFYKANVVLINRPGEAGAVLQTPFVTH